MAGYICKIAMEDTHPPVWRRVVIPDKITFVELHDIVANVNDIVLSSSRKGNSIIIHWRHTFLPVRQRLRQNLKACSDIRLAILH